MSIPVTEPADLLPLGVSLDDGDAPGDVVDALALTRFTTGAEPWSRTAVVSPVRESATLLPVHARVIRRAQSENRTVLLAEGEGWTLKASWWRNGGDRNGEVVVTAVDDALAERVLAEAIEGAEKEKETREDVVSMGFWHMGGHGPVRSVRSIDAASWPEIRGNYTRTVSGAFDSLLKLTPEQLPGRLLLMHGPPGTGKTSVMRTLARAWRDWCEVDCVLDPERLFADPGYLIQVSLGLQRAGGRPDAGSANHADEPWRLLLLEDCDELIRGGAKNSAGQALSRLLNLTDGLLGQGRRVLVAITTNEDLQRLHPAVVRPGRCLARIEVGPLTAAESAAWLAARAVGDAAQPRFDRPGGSGGFGERSGSTLAELFALLREGSGPDLLLPEPTPSRDGLYL